MDGSYLDQLHQTKLTDSTQVSRKKSLSRAVVSYLISHADIWTDLSARAVLLRLADSIHDDTKVTLIRPQVLQALQSTSPVVEQSLTTDIDQYTSSLIRSYDTLPKGGLSEEDLALFLQILKNRSSDRK
jgi:hypothetical protein